MDFNNQFFFVETGKATTDLNIPQDFLCDEYLGKSLYYSSNLPLTKLNLKDGSNLWILGWLFYNEEKIITQSTLEIYDYQEFLQSSIINEACGRYIVIHFSESGVICVNGDAAGTLSAFYHVGFLFLCSTIELVNFINYPVDTDVKLEEQMEYCEQQCHYWYPGGFSELRDIRLLLPNHYLELGQLKPQRFWPSRKEFTKEAQQSLLELTQQSTKIINQTVRSYASLGRISLPITGGRDSRIILSSIYTNNLGEMTTCYTEGDNESLDSRLGRTLAKSCKIKWLDHKPDQNSLNLPGFGGEICKGYWYRNINFDIEDNVQRVYEAIPFTQHISHDKIKEFIFEWIREALQLLPDEQRVVDLAYLEFRWAATMGQVHYRFLDKYFKLSMCVLASRSFVEYSLMLPLNIRQRMSFGSLICKINAPHLRLLPAGIPHYSLRELPSLFCLLIFGWLLKPQFKIILYSKALRQSMQETLNLFLKQKNLR